jgi:hypothetical protein
MVLLAVPLSLLLDVPKSIQQNYYFLNETLSSQQRQALAKQTHLNFRPSK